MIVPTRPTHHCAALGLADTGRDVTLMGWVERIRDLGGLLFLDLRDYRGVTQIVVRPDSGPAAAARRLGAWWVVAVEGVVLAREAEIAYASLAHVTDFDSWHSHEADVTSDLVLETLLKNIEMVQRALAKALAQIDEDKIDPTHTALGSALATPGNAMDANVIDRLRPILARVLDLD